MSALTRKSAPVARGEVSVAEVENKFSRLAISTPSSIVAGRTYTMTPAIQKSFDRQLELLQEKERLEAEKTKFEQKITQADQKIAVARQMQVDGRQTQVDGRQMQTQGKAMQAQGQEMKAQGQTMQTQGQTMRTQGQAMQAQGQEMKTQGQAIQTQGQTMQTQGQTMRTQGQTMRTQGQEMQAQGKGTQTVGTKEASEAHAKVEAQLAGISTFLRTKIENIQKIIPNPQDKVRVAILQQLEGFVVEVRSIQQKHNQNLDISADLAQLNTRSKPLLQQIALLEKSAPK